MFPVGLTKCYEHWKINVTISVNKKNASPPSGHVFQPTETIFKLAPLTRKNGPPHCGHVFEATGTIFELVQDIIGTDLLTTKSIYAPSDKNVALRELTWQMLTPHNARQTMADYKGTPRAHCAQGMVFSRVLTRKMPRPLAAMFFNQPASYSKIFHDIIGMNLLTKQNAPPLSSHVFQAKVTILEFQYIIWQCTNAKEVNKALQTVSMGCQIPSEIDTSALGVPIYINTRFSEGRPVSSVTQVIIVMGPKGHYIELTV
ncbi:hypothetical protein DPMN_187392 [Dreissena polymorpha]|uniref:Uncharacterized protein n=1 Tax=Dreissena polymorpha TaxID=45954 RepID=A0A9D4DNZ1_DREPO|nr:hypothetical protein DPMN_187392 [Dreissena polymorpha]